MATGLVGHRLPRAVPLLVLGMLLLGCAQTAAPAAPTAAPKAGAPAVGGAAATAPTAAPSGASTQEVKIGVLYPL
ncbi:MAG TPA: hypothetical protein VFD42_07265, partial [Chloroflexota bacterium]|nr:hypothetical protein [Chloroflexota bacterium]